MTGCGRWATRISGMRVLLVEDDPAQMDCYCRILESLGCVVFAAVMAETGIELARTVQVDAILTDNVLPGMTGLQSIAKYSESTNASVLIMTSHFNGDIEKDALLLGAKGVFVKPLVWEAVTTALAAYLGKSEDGRPR